MKKATTIEEQIEKLQKRGIILDLGLEKSKEILSDIGYFRFGYYCFPFEVDYPNKVNRTHSYKKETTISEIKKLYYFNLDLTNILLKYISRIEINLRTTIIYEVSNYYQDSPAWFADKDVMDKTFISGLNVEYAKLEQRHKVLGEHHKKYKKDEFAPAWKTIEYFSFGALNNLYRHLKNAHLKSCIACRYGIKSYNVFSNYLTIIVTLRNMCAHSNVLFDEFLPIGVKNGPAVFVNLNNNYKLYSYIKVVEFILRKISKNRSDEMMDIIHELFEDHKRYSTINNIISNNIGYSL